MEVSDAVRRLLAGVTVVDVTLKGSFAQRMTISVVGDDVIMYRRIFDDNDGQRGL